MDNNGSLSLTLAELALIDRALMLSEYMDANNTTPDPVSKEEIAQRKILYLPLRLRTMQLTNQLKEKQA